MANYRWSICEPDQPKVIEKGLIAKEDIMATFEKFPWIERLRMMETMEESAIKYSPSIGFENLDTKQEISFSIVGVPDENEFYIFYTRPKTMKSFLGLSKREINNFTSNITGQTMEDATRILMAFINNETDWLEEKVK